MQKLIQWFRKVYVKVIHSIAFVPALVAFGFLILAIVMMELDESGAGLNINENIKWLRLNDVDTARSVVATVTGGIISLTVFNFSIFMVVLNQAASQMSNRMLDNMIGDRFQKLILSCYIGTIVYSLFLLTSISEGKHAIYIPALSIYLLLVLTIINIFLFIFFLHYVTQAFRYEKLIQKMHGKTSTALKQQQKEAKNRVFDAVLHDGIEVNAPQSGYFQHFNQELLLRLAETNNFVIQFLHPTGSFVLQNTPFLKISGINKISNDIVKNLFSAIDFYHGQQISGNAYYGFQHLMEVAVKALSPGINDPGTAILCLHALTDLLAFNLKHPVPPVITGKEGIPRLFTVERSIHEIFETSVKPILHYGRDDEHVRQAILQMIHQLTLVDAQGVLKPTLYNFLQQVKRNQKESETF